MEVVTLVLYFGFFICAALSAFRVPDSPRVNIGWLGLMFFALALLIGGLLPLVGGGHFGTHGR
jgi:hypothetical protein